MGESHNDTAAQNLTRGSDSSHTTVVPVFRHQTWCAMARVVSLKKTEPVVEPESSSTKERLLQVAKELFARKGFHGTSTREITRRAGASLSSLHFHWQSKENLYLAVYRQLFELLTTLGQELIVLLEE